MDERAEFVKWMLFRYSSPDTEGPIRRMSERYWDSEDPNSVLRPPAKEAWLARADLAEKELQDAARWRFSVANNCFPTLGSDGTTWVVWHRNRDHKRRAYMGDTPDEAIDLAMAGGNSR